MTRIEDQIDFLMQKMKRIESLKRRGNISEDDCDYEIAMYDGIIDRLMALAEKEKVQRATDTVKSIFKHVNQIK